jgi:hypothetical protein
MCSPLTWERAREVYVGVQKTGCRRCKIAQCVAGDFGALTGLANTCPGAAVLLHAWPHKMLCKQLRRCFGVGVRQIMYRLEHLEP